MGLSNAGLTGGTRRAIDIREGETVDAEAFKALVREAVARNVEKQGAGRGQEQQMGSLRRPRLR